LICLGSERFALDLAAAGAVPAPLTVRSDGRAIDSLAPKAGFDGISTRSGCNACRGLRGVICLDSAPTAALAGDADTRGGDGGAAAPARAFDPTFTAGWRGPELVEALPAAPFCIVGRATESASLFTLGVFAGRGEADGLGLVLAGNFDTGFSSARASTARKRGAVRSPPSGGALESVTAPHPFCCDTSTNAEPLPCERMLAYSSTPAQLNDGGPLWIAGQCGANMAKG
jgi:hypothetical protein